MKVAKKTIGLLLAGLVLLPGCVHVPNYKCVPLQVIGDNCTYRAIHQNLVVRAKLLNTAGRYVLFKERVQKLYDHDIIYLSVHNLSNIAYVISSNSVDLKQTNSMEIAELIEQTSSEGRFAGSAFTGFYAGMGIKTFIHDSATVGALGYIVLPMIIGLSVASLVMGIAGIKSVAMNNRISNDLADKTLSKVVVINSGDKYESLIFVKTADCRSNFTITMHEKNNKNNRIIFDVNLGG